MGALNDPLVGRTIAQYEILARVGGGAMGVVYQARDTKLGRRVALKFLPQQWSHDESAKQRFVREAQAASATDHPNICTIHDIETADDGQLFIVMAFYEGTTLKQRLESGPIAIDDALEIATQLADGLAKAHAQGVVHRDVKPGNIMLTEDGVRILDFGLATFVDALKLTAENASFGTPAYMSPEQVRGLATDARTDVWAAGVVLYEMLAGHVPFQGSHAEAIAQAVRNESPRPLRTIRPDIPEEIEQLVFRALHKEPSVRFPGGRELAKALRRVRGLSMPLELRTEPVTPPAPAAATPRRRSMRLAVSAALVGSLAVALTWVTWPIERAPVAVVPFINETGYPELDAYRLALTEELIAQLMDAKSIRVLPHERLLQILRPFLQGDRDVSGRDAVQALAKYSGAQTLIVPVVTYKDNAWSVRVEFRNPETGTHRGDVVATPQKSALMKDAVYRQLSELSRGIDAHFTSNGPVRASLLAGLGRLMSSPPSSPPSRFRNLDAAASFERGIGAYEQLELASARQAFEDAAKQDPRNPLPLAWQSRMAALMRQDRESIAAADAAERLLSDGVSDGDRIFVRAVGAEAQRDTAAAEAAYKQLVERYPDQPSWLIELANFLDRRGAVQDAIEIYHRVLREDGQLVRPHLELCRLYSPSRVNEPALAKEQGRVALELSRTLRNEGWEAQALWCLTDVLRAGSDTERMEARQHAEAALAIVQRLQYPFGIARGYNYVSIVALLAEKNAARALPLLQETLAAARKVGFVLLESRALMNLGSALEMLGRRSSALEQFRSSFTLSEQLGNQQDAAWNQINIAAILVDYGDDPDTGLREAQNALGVFQSLQDADFEAFARQIIGSHYRHIGDFDEATKQLTLGLNVARARNLDTKVAQLSIELARVRFDAADYGHALELLQQAARNASGLNSIHTDVELGRAYARLGEFDVARMHLDRAATAITQTADSGSLPLLNRARGELEYELSRLDAARVHLLEASQLWVVQELPEDASVAARASLGLVHALQGDVSRGSALVLDSLQRARRTRRTMIEAQCLVFLARIAVHTGNGDEAIRRLSEMPIDRVGALNPELSASVRYWFGRARALQGDVSASAESSAARRVLGQWLAGLPAPSRPHVLLRPDIRLIQGGDGVATGAVPNN